MYSKMSESESESLMVMTLIAQGIETRGEEWSRMASGNGHEKERSVKSVRGFVYIRAPESALSIIFLPAHTFAIDTLRVNNNIIKRYM